MVKARTRPKGDQEPVSQPTDIEKKVAAFAAGADLNPGDVAAPAELDKNASRDHKSLRIPFNEYEWKVLEELSQHENRSKLNMVRQAILREAERLGLL
ncbi:hypothetical protein C1Y41_19555 [Pantoea sp. ICBG 1758]|uniref:hypothetical protein n=1 Tax=Pantoea sp. ICBG 1758 TaxID=2071682 RepID=UPI000CE427BF|nr:hypothetical protein [Pantoea sp. ICBG 1758]PPC61163.1 hypothetical protein C1Y41_19555 [Pantoea sp. ICBG 1758]